MPADKPTKQTPAEIIAAMFHSHSPLRMPDEPFDCGCLACELAAANTAYLETVVQVAMEHANAYVIAHWRWSQDVDRLEPRKPTDAEVLAEADAKFREGT